MIGSSKLSDLRERADRYIYSITYPGTTDFEDQDEEIEDVVKEDLIGSDFTTSDLYRGVFFVTTILAIFTTIWHFIYFIDPFILPVPQGVPYRASHLFLMGAMAFLATLSTDSEHPWRRRIYNGTALVLIAGLAAGTAYVLIEYQELWTRAGSATQMDFIISVILILVTVEGSRRAYGNIFPILAAAAVAYGLWGNYLPGFVSHGGMSVERLATAVAIPSMVGLFGFLLSLSATLITVFIFFGVFLQHLGGAEYFADLAMRITQGLKSGPAQVAILSSGLMGMLNGAAVANVAATGSFTIPLMKRMGYDEEFSGAVESVASCGGQVMPPIMGASAFIMASILGRPYFEIIAAAAIPAVLYYFTLMLTAHIRALKVGFDPFLEDAESLTSLLVRSYYFIPILVIIYTLYLGDPAVQAAWEGLKVLMILALAYYIIQGRSGILATVREFSLSPEIKGIVLRYVRAFDDATRVMAPLVMLLAMLGWIIQLLNATGLLGKIAAGMVFLAGGELFPLLILAAAVSILFGLGIPTTGAYIIVALIGAPAIIRLGVPGISAHLFVFYYAVLSAISPPVAAACLVASGISRGSFLGTCKDAMQIALPAYILPFVWIYNPNLLGQGSPLGILATVVAVVLGIVMIVAFFEGFLITHATKLERVAMAGLAALLIWPSMLFTTVGVAGVASVLVVQAHRTEDGITTTFKRIVPSSILR
jgi:TRAP transporter 4TM/12TM fusion protein